MTDTQATAEESFGTKVATAIARYVEAVLSLENAELLLDKDSMSVGVLRLRDRSVVDARKAIADLFDGQMKEVK